MAKNDRLAFRCASCGGINRVDPARVGSGPMCGRCHVPLSLDGGPVGVTDDELVRLVTASPVPVLVDFFATWCGPCRAVAPIVEQVAQARAGKLIVVKVDIDRDPGFAGRLGVSGVPTFVLFKGGEAVRTQSGAVPRPALEAMLD